MTKEEKKQLMATACKVRMGVIKGTHAAKAGHPGGSLSAADLFTYLYCKELNVDPKNPKWEGPGPALSCPRATPPPACTPALAPAGLLPGGGPAHPCARSAATSRATPT